jgi:redox-sensing transcriptional repressor
MSDSNTPKSIPTPTIKRWSVYWSYLKKLDLSEQTFISSARIASDLGLDPIKVRKDIAMTGAVGTARKGFEIEPLMELLEDKLGWSQSYEAFLVGCGNLGRALLGYKAFRSHGLNIVAAFDANPRVVGKSISGLKINSTKNLISLSQKRKFQIGVITVPDHAAQEAADLLIQSGAQAIWNFSPESLQVPDHIMVENIRLASSLSLLTSRLPQPS